jgi:hypothetical protein
VVTTDDVEQQVEEVVSEPAALPVSTQTYVAATATALVSAPRSSLRDRLSQLFGETKPAAAQVAPMMAASVEADQPVAPEIPPTPAPSIAQSTPPAVAAPSTPAPTPVPEKKPDDTDDIYSLKNFSI